jgi:LmbE family N-acetylglucosaminyl deacetylase
MSAAAIEYRFTARWLEYPIWLWASQKSSDAPHGNEIVPHRLDITEVLPIKRQAVHAYQSQISNLIDDDPDGFRLSAADLAHFDRPWELFFESIPTRGI